MVLVTGASGQVGKHLLQALSAKGINSRAWIHSERSKEDVLAAGAKEVYIGDLNSCDDAVEAINGIDTVYFICNTANPHEDEIGVHFPETNQGTESPTGKNCIFSGSAGGYHVGTDPV